MGDNSYGQLGTAPPPANSPVQIATGVWLSRRGFHSLFLKADGSLRATGATTKGSLGRHHHQRTVRSRSPPAWWLSPRDLHTLFLKADGGLRAMGYNSDGELGTGDTTDRTVPLRSQPVY